MAHVQHSSVIPIHKHDLYEFLSDYRKRTRIMPPDIVLELTSLPLDLKKGAEHEFKLTRFGLSYSLSLIVESCEQDQSIIERAQFSYFEEWVNSIRFEDHGEKATLLTNAIDYKIPFGVLGALADDLFIKKDMQRILEFSHNKIKSFFT